MQQKLIVSTLIIGSLIWTSPVKADLRFELQSEENQLTLTGSCDADVHIELYEGENFELDPLYTAVAPCTNEAFAHDDNLLKWGIADGQYKLVVEGDRHTIRDFIVKQPPVTTEEMVAREAREKGLPTEVGLSADQIFENAQASFGNKLYSLETDLITMQESLKDTSYPDFIKVGLSGALSTVEVVTKKLQETFFIVEQRNFEEKATSIESLPKAEPIAPVVSPNSETTSTPVEESLETAPEPETETLPTEETATP